MRIQISVVIIGVFLAGAMCATELRSAPATSVKPGAASGAVKPGMPADKGVSAPAVMSDADKAALQQASEAYNKGDFALARTMFTALAEKGNDKAAFALGLMAIRGNGMPQSPVTAGQWWLKAARAGYPDAQYHLGLLHFRGLVGPRDIAVAREWWTQAANAGQGDAMFALGQLLRSGDGGAHDLPGAARWLGKAAELGHPAAQYELSLMYETGQGMRKDAAKAKSWLQKSAAAGFPPAQQKLGGVKK